MIYVSESQKIVSNIFNFEYHCIIYFVEIYELFDWSQLSARNMK